MMKGIVLIGFMGAGKSSVGRILSAKLGVPLVDTDAVIEERAGRKIKDIFAHDGEEAFRRFETATLQSLPESAAVYATGGGVVTRPENWPALKRLGLVVHLHGSAEALFERVKHETHRPLLQTANPRESFDSLMRAREALYRQADVTVDTDGRAPQDIAEEILRKANEASAPPRL